MKYMLMMFGDAATMLEERTPEWVDEMLAFMGRFNAQIEKSGELVEAHGLAYPAQAKTISLVDGQVVVTDGPFAEAKESLAGYWVLEVPDLDRAVELASQVAVYAQSVELRLFWYTQGKGDQDVGVVATVPFPEPASQDRRDFRIPLPLGPYSFSGKLISLMWALEVVAEPGSRAGRLEITVSPTRREIQLQPHLPPGPAG